MQQSTRFEIDGVRHYRAGDNPNRIYPSVTAVLGKTAGAKAQQALHSWNLRNPGARDAAARRGSAIHAACEDYIRGKTVSLEPELQPYWDGVARHLDQYDGFLWSERPLRREWSYCTGKDGISRIWSHRHGYSGCPDIVGIRRNVIWLSDVKSSVGPYCRYFPKENNRENFGGWKKFGKCGLQLGAYAIALEETLGIEIELAHMLVTTPETVQSFVLRGHELQAFRYKWLQRVAEYYRLVAAEKELAALEESDKLAIPLPGERILVAA